MPGSTSTWRPVEAKGPVIGRITPILTVSCANAGVPASVASAAPAMNSLLENETMYIPPFVEHHISLPEIRPRPGHFPSLLQRKKLMPRKLLSNINVYIKLDMAQAATPVGPANRAWRKHGWTLRPNGILRLRSLRFAKANLRSSQLCHIAMARTCFIE